MNNPFAPEKLNRALERASGRHSDEFFTKSTEEAGFLEERKLRLANPLSLFSRRFYREAMKEWPKPEANYNWLYEDDIVECNDIKAHNKMAVAERCSPFMFFHEALRESNKYRHLNKDYFLELKHSFKARKEDLPKKDLVCFYAGNIESSLYTREALKPRLDFSSILTVLAVAESSLRSLVEETHHSQTSKITSSFLTLLSKFAGRVVGQTAVTAFQPHVLRSDPSIVSMSLEACEAQTRYRMTAISELLMIYREAENTDQPPTVFISVSTRHALEAARELVKAFSVNHNEDEGVKVLQPLKVLIEKQSSAS